MTSQPAGGTPAGRPRAQPRPRTRPWHTRPRHHVVRRTRTGGTWVAAALGTGATAPASSCYVKLRAWCRVSDVAV